MNLKLGISASSKYLKSKKEVWIMSNKLGSLFALLLLVSASYGCVTTLKEYEPTSSAEGDIKALLVSYEDAWNEHDVGGILALWHDEADIMYGSERKIASKEEYVDVLPGRINNTPYIEFKNPQIVLKGDRAIAELKMDTRRYVIPVKFNLVVENNEWVIMSWQY